MSLQASSNSLVYRISTTSFTKSEKRIRDTLLDLGNDVVYLTITELAKISNTSDATILRFCKKLGCTGYQHFKLQLAQELPAQKTVVEKRQSSNGNELQGITNEVFEQALEELTLTRRALDLGKINTAVNAIIEASCVEIYGIGTSAPLASLAHSKLLRLGIPGRYYQDPHLQMMSIATWDDNTLFMAISHSGSTKDTVAVAKTAKEKGAKIITITSYGDSPLADMGDINLFVAGSKLSKLVSESSSSQIAQLAIIQTLYLGVLSEKGQEGVDSICFRQLRNR